MTAKLSEALKTVMTGCDGKELMKKVSMEFVPLSPADMRRESQV